MAKQRVSAYFNDEIQALLNKYKQIEDLIPKQLVKKDGDQAAGSDHTAEEGRFIESIIRNALNKYLPKNLKALSGFILRPETILGENDNFRVEENLGDQHSTQLDIIVFDIGNYPIYEQFEEFAIVPPEGVIAVISVKKTLRKKDIKHELMTLVDVASLCRHYVRKEGTPIGNKERFEQVNVVGPATILLAFSSELGVKPINEIALEIFTEFITPQQELPYDAIIKLITVLDSFSILKAEEHAGTIKTKGVETAFVLFKHLLEDDENKIEHYDVGIQLVLQSILKVYYHRTRSPFIVKPGYEKIDNVFRIKDRLGYLFSNGYKITGPIQTAISINRNAIRQALLKGEAKK